MVNYEKNTIKTVVKLMYTYCNMFVIMTPDYTYSPYNNTKIEEIQHGRNIIITRN